jgi:23S rRNA (guanine2069-N7)-methyltransferase
VPGEKFISFQNRLQKVYRHLHKQAKGLGVTCYRVYDNDLPEFPFCIELYEEKLYVAEYKRRHGMTEHEHNQWLIETLNVMKDVLQVNNDNLFLKLRQRKEGRLGQYRKSSAKQHEFVVHENGLGFIVNLSDYLDTGLFLDHRVTREKVKAEAKDKNVLNLFCYTGSFSVYAAAGGAMQVTSVDLSKKYLQWARKNMQLNGFVEISPSAGGRGGQNRYPFIQADATQYLKSIPPDYFDLVVLDPPTFSNSQRMQDFLDVQQDHVELINDCLRGMKTAGILYFSTNYTKFILEIDKINSHSVRDITKQTTPFDFQGKLRRYCYRIIK